MAARRVVVWFRNDLRLHDCAPLHEAVTIAQRTPGTEVLPVYCFDPRQYGTTDDVFLGKGFGAPKTGHHRAKFILESVLDLKARLRTVGSDLLILVGEPEKMLSTMAVTGRPSTGGDNTQLGPLILASAEVCPEECGVERAVARAVRPGGGSLSLFHNATLYHREDVLKQFGPELERMPDGFTPFKNAVERNCELRKCLPPPSAGQLPLPAADPASGRDMDFCPKLQQLPWAPAAAGEGKTLTPKPGQGPSAFPWSGGEGSGLARVEHYFFGSDSVANYFGTRNGMLGTDYSTKFAPWLSVGALSPLYIQSRLSEYERTRTENKSTYWVRFEMTWRDYFRFFAEKHGHAIFQPYGLKHPAAAPKWRDDDAGLERWKQGTTGWPLIDANMRELAATGWMSNRGRQNVASFLILDLGIDWRRGAEHFEALLLDYDTASNWGNWVAAAGLTGGRVNKFNITKQSKDYDPNGDYVRAWLPELASVPGQYVHQPSNMPGAVQQQSGCLIGSDYPSPLKTAGHNSWSGGGGDGGGGRGRGGGGGKQRNGGRGGGGQEPPGGRGGEGKRSKAKTERRQHRSRVGGGWAGDA